jgi:hypothetical protein
MLSYFFIRSSVFEVKELVYIIFANFNNSTLNVSITQPQKACINFIQNENVNTKNMVSVYY